MTKNSSLKSVIARCHRDLNTLFFLHQEAVLIGEMSAAIDSLQRFAEAHKLHKEFEDEHLLKRLAEIDDPGDWPTSLYKHEHSKIDDTLKRVEENIRRLQARKLNGTALNFGIIEILDREKSFKGLCEHHQEREEAGMLPALDRYTEPEWRNAIIVPFIEAWSTTVTVPVLPDGIPDLELEDTQKNPVLRSLR